MSVKQEKQNSAKAKGVSESVTHATIQLIAGVTGNARDALMDAAEKVNASIEKNKRTEAEKKEKQFEKEVMPLIGTEAEKFVRKLGYSPIELTNNKTKLIKECFPVPKEQTIVWADAEFDLRPSGIALTDKGIYIKTDATVFGQKKKDPSVETSTKEKPVHSKSELFFYRWSDFEPGWFVGEEQSENKALLVNPRCSRQFVQTCRTIEQQALSDEIVEKGIDIEQECGGNFAAGGVAGAAVESAHSAVFVEQKARVNTAAGHGEMAEEAITKLDKLFGLDAEVLGRDNAKNGPDRRVGSVLIQTKYYKTARGSLEACFDPQTGMYRYKTETGELMQLEVPKDQYYQVLEGFKQKIVQNKVPGVTDPDEAANIVRKGRLTYQKAVNLTKPGTIDSLAYDALTGIVTCSCALGISFAATVYLAWRKTKDMKEAIRAGTSAGLHVFGLSFVQHMVVSQFARTETAKLLLTPSNYVVQKIGPRASAKIVNAIRLLAGKSAIHGVAASKHLAKMLRSNVLSSVLSFAVFSVPETYNLVYRKISGAQYMKNLSVLAGSIVGGTGGAIAAGIATAKVVGAAGSLAGGVGAIAGIVGGFVGGAIGSKTIKAAGDILREDDFETVGRLFNAYVSCLCGEYMLDEKEIDELIEQLNAIKTKELQNMFYNVIKADEQECIVKEFIEPHFEMIVSKRERFATPSAESIMAAVDEMVETPDANAVAK